MPNAATDGALSALPITVGTFSGYAISSHTFVDPDDESRTRRIRSPLGQALFEYRYQGRTEHLAMLAKTFGKAIHECFGLRKEKIDRLCMVPPHIGRPEYPRMIALSGAICTAASIASAQCAILNKTEYRAGQESAETFYADKAKLFSLPSEKSVSLIKNCRLLVIDDLFRSGSTLSRCCATLQQGRPHSIHLLVGTKI
ncbi:MAG: hypothetical protein GF398_15695 [Chitinivibrionales bacterium]|nr:hypothetical protein [Chitinivibrionales bacterium]